MEDAIGDQEAEVDAAVGQSQSKSTELMDKEDTPHSRQQSMWQEGDVV